VKVAALWVARALCFFGPIGLAFALLVFGYPIAAFCAGAATGFVGGVLDYALEDYARRMR